MRKIKFRGRDVITGNWAYGYYYPSKGNSIIRDDNDRECIVMPETVGQLVGLHDKNGKEIYEGDLVKRHNYLYKVVYDVECASYKNKVIARQNDDQHEIWVEISDDRYYQLSQDLINEVIGNIYENADLLK